MKGPFGELDVRADPFEKDSNARPDGFLGTSVIVELSGSWSVLVSPRLHEDFSA